MSLFNEVIRSGAPVRKIYNEFFKDYADLNNFTPPTPEVIRNYQLAKLEAFQSASLRNNKKVQELNTYFQTNGNFNENSEFEKTVSEAISNIYNNILPRLRSSGALSQDYLSSNKALYNKTLQLLNELQNQLNFLRNQAGLSISGTYIDRLDALFNQVPGATVFEIMKNFFLLQGEILEELGTEWFNERVPSNLQIQAVSTGQLNISGKGQSISDILFFDMDKINSKIAENVQIKFKIGKNGTPQKLSLKDFFNLMDSYSGSKQIVLQQPQLNKVMKAVTMGAQAKSGANQKPWNIGAKNTWVSIKDFQPMSIVYIFERLSQLQQTWDPQSRQMKVVSPAYQAFADYGVASMLSKILHLSQTENQYLLTTSGFITYTERILELYRGNGYYFTVKNVKLNKDIFKDKPVDLKN